MQRQISVSSAAGVKGLEDVTVFPAPPSPQPARGGGEGVREDVKGRQRKERGGERR